MWSKAIVISLALVASQCTVSDDERCPDGFTYRKDTMSCHMDEDTSGNRPDASPDAATGQGAFQGIGTSCKENKDCADFAADYCAVNPAVGVGFCTVKDCEPGGCPAGYTCCDCRESSMVDQEAACITDDYVAGLQALAQCTC